MGVKVSVVSPINNRVSIQSDKRQTIRTVNVLPSVGNLNSLDSLSDVVITSPANNQVLIYDETISQFTNKTLTIISGGEF
jgi:hypothetical protein